MQIFLRFEFILLFIVGLFTSPVSAHDFQKVDDVQIVQESSFSSTPDQNISSWLEKLQLTQKQTGSKKAVKNNQDGSKFVQLDSQSLLSFAQHDPFKNEPDYYLAFEFTPPLALSLTIGYRIDFSQTLDWSLHVGKKPSRLSGWKETNLLYRLSQISLLS